MKKLALQITRRNWQNKLWTDKSIPIQIRTHIIYNITNFFIVDVLIRKYNRTWKYLDIFVVDLKKIAVI